MPYLDHTPSATCRVRVGKSKSEIQTESLDANEYEVSNDVFSIVDSSALTVTSPNGGEVIEPGKNFTISWISGSAIDIENVRLEYSPDNGTTYLPIADDVPNTGKYEWLVPYHLSPHCLVRISSADDNKKHQDFNLTYEFKFQVNERKLENRGNDFTIRLGDTNSILSISFNGEPDGKEYISFDDASVELGSYEDFQLSWHTIKIVLDNGNEKVSVILDEKPVLENIPLSRMYRFKPAVSFAVGEGVDVSIDDFCVKMKETDNGWHVLFNEDFDRLIDEKQLKESGWIQPMYTIKEKVAESAGETNDVSIVKSNNAGQSLKFPAETLIVKFFQVPWSFPFDASDKPFKIRYNDDMDNSMSPISIGNASIELSIDWRIN
ncbi:MAG TPA: hypothetical protein VK469_23385 [Candidatus Kapabacteria bacterium]|nr:hypothetical protein [Candidatus Kapabacteria bacterium]